MTQPNRAHVTSEWATGRITVQVTHQTDGGRTVAYVADPFTPTSVPCLKAVYVAHTEDELERESEERGRAPGISFTEDDAVLIWEALDEYLNNTGTHPTKALQEAQQARQDAEFALGVLQAQHEGALGIIEALRDHLADLRADKADGNPTVYGPRYNVFDQPPTKRNVGGLEFRPSPTVFCGHLSKPGIGGEFQPPRRCTKRPHAEDVPHTEDGGYSWGDDGYAL